MSDKKKKRGPKFSPFSKEFYMHYRDMSEEDAIFEAKSKRPTNVEYWIRKGFSKEEAKEQLSEYQASNGRRWAKKRKENPEKYQDTFPTQIGYWIKKGFSKEEAKQQLKLRQTTNTIANIMERTGCTIEEAKQKRNDITQKWLTSLRNKSQIEIDKINERKRNTLENFILKYGEDEGQRRYEKCCKLKALTLENFIRRHGDVLGQKLYDEYRNKIKGMFSYEWFINRYGNEEGTELYFNRLKKIIVGPGNSSKESLKYFEPLRQRLIIEDNLDTSQIYLGIEESNEWFIRKNDKIYFYDFTIPYYKFIIEYHGSAFHPNPSWDKTTWDNWRCAYTKLTASEKRLFDEEKNRIANEAGFAIVEIWSDDPEDLNWRKINESIEKYCR